MSAAPRPDRPAHEQITLDHFRALYRTLDPEEISRRCALPFLKEKSAFALRIMGNPCLAAFPEFELLPEVPAEGPGDGCSGEKTGGPSPGNGKNPSASEKILFLRYLCEGRYAETAGKQLSYREIPWGNLYYPNFEGRCIKRLARSFGDKLEHLEKIMEEHPGFRAKRLDKGEASRAACHAVCHTAYRFEFCGGGDRGLYMSFFLWAADEEFPASAQILFDDNFPAAFTAEDIAVACGIAVDHLKEFSILRN